MSKPNGKTPDEVLTVVVKDGDTLDSLSQQYYNDPGYAAAIAAYNGLDKYRHPKPGTALLFPPLAMLT